MLMMICFSLTAFTLYGYNWHQRGGHSRHVQGKYVLPRLVIGSMVSSAADLAMPILAPIVFHKRNSYSRMPFVRALRSFRDQKPISGTQR